MFLDDQSIKYNLNFLSSTLKQNIIHQAASMLLQHINFQKNLNQNSNGNALDEHHRHHIRRTNKCNSWLSKYPTKSDTSLNQLPILFESSSRIKHSNFSMNKSHYNQLISSSNTNSNIEPTFSQPLMLIHKKRIHRDYFLSTIQNCIQPPYSQNHFYAFDQFNLLKLQQNNYFQSKRKYSDIDNDELEDIDFNQKSLKKQNISQLKTADHISINKYHDKIDNSIIFDEKPESQIILSRLEKILNLCEELRSLANDVENHLQEKQLNNEKSQSEQTLIDIYKELEIEQIINEIDENNVSPIYEISSIHSESNKSHSLMETESFKTKSISHTTLRKPEDLCTCFLKSIFEKENCQLNLNEQEYLNQLTKAYLLGREQILKEQHEQNNKFQAFINENLQDEQIDANNNNNNNQSITPLNPSSSLLYNNFEKFDDHLISTPLKSNDSIISLNKQSSTISSVIITAKHQVFITEPIAMKTTQVLPGIGTKYAQQLAECGFSTVRRLLGFYLMIKDDQNFVNWLNTKPQISIYSAWLCTNALRAWCQTHL